MQQLATCPCNKSLPRQSGGLVPLDAVFLDVDPTAIAAASIAQVFENYFSLLMLQSSYHLTQWDFLLGVSAL